MKWIVFNQLSNVVEIVLGVSKDGFHVSGVFYVVVMTRMWQSTKVVKALF